MILRSLSLLIPLAILTWLFMGQRLSPRNITALLMGFIWAFLSLLILNIVLLKQGVWVTTISDSLFYGVPMDWLFSHAIIIGGLIPLLRLIPWNMQHANFRYPGQIIFISLLYFSAGLNFLEPMSYLVITCTLLCCALPATLLSDWTAYDSNIRSRSLLQSLAWAIHLLWLFPATVFNLTSDSWQVLLERDLWLTGLYLLPMIIPASLIISALYQFAAEGDGTAFPYDPPKKLVTGGIYRYISNPMQTGICILMGWYGIVLQSVWIIFSAVIAVILFIVFKDVCNGSCAIGKESKEWQTYQAAVPKWLPRFAPWYDET